MPTAHLVRVRATLDFVGVLPIGSTNLTPEEAVKQKFKMMDASISGFVLEKRDFHITTKPVEEENMPQ